MSKLNPNAKTFAFNPNAKSFSFTPSVPAAAAAPVAKEGDKKKDAAGAAAKKGGESSAATKSKVSKQATPAADKGKDQGKKDAPGSAKSSPALSASAPAFTFKPSSPAFVPAASPVSPAASPVKPTSSKPADKSSTAAASNTTASSTAASTTAKPAEKKQAQPSAGKYSVKSMLAKKGDAADMSTDGSAAEKAEKAAEKAAAEAAAAASVSSSPSKPLSFAEKLKQPKQAGVSQLSVNLPEDAATKAAKAAAKVENRLSSEQATEAQLERTLVRSELKYEREFLLSFAGKFTERPADLPDLEKLIGDRVAAGGPSSKGKGAGGFGKPGTPRTGQRSGTPRAGQSTGPTGFRQGQGRDGDRRQQPRDNRNRDNQPRHGKGGNGRRRGGPDAPMDIEIVPLEVSENRYVRSKKQDLEETETIMRDYKSILNKLTPEKFDVLIMRADALAPKITSVELLSGVVSSVFEKALLEPHFCPTYADFCLHLSQEGKLPTFSATLEDGSELEQGFKRLVLNRCQDEFERDAQEESIAKVAQMTDAEKEQHRADAKKRMLGTIRFIGELFARQMLSVVIIRHCLIILFGDVDNPVAEDVEALCKLFDTIGKLLDHVAPSFVDDCFVNIVKLSTNKSIDSRYRFMCQDTIDLRQRHWRTRMKKETAMKLKDIKKEAEKSQSSRPDGQRRDNRSVQERMRDGKPNSSSSGSGDVRSNVQRRTFNKKEQETDDDGWATVGNGPPSVKSSAGKRMPMFSKQSTTEAQEALAAADAAEAAGEKISFSDSSINKSSSSANLAAKDDTDSGPVMAGGAFAAFGSDSEDEDDDQDTEEEDAGNSGKRSRSNSSKKKMSAGDDQAFDDATLEHKIKGMLKEYMQIEDVKEALLCLDDLRTSRLNDRVVFQALELCMEARTDKQRASLNTLLAALVTNKRLTAKQCVKAVTAFLKLTDDLIIDSPKVLIHTAQVVATLIVAGVIPFDYLDSKHVAHLNASGHQSALAAHVLLALHTSESCKKTEAEVLKLYEASGVAFGMLMKPHQNDVKAYIEKGWPQLAFMVGKL